MDFSLCLHQWFGFQMLPGYVGAGACAPFFAPVFINEFKPLKTGRGELEVGYFNPLYAEGVQQFSFRLKVLVRTDSYLVARLLESSSTTPTRTAVFCPAHFSWLRACCPDLLNAWPPESFGDDWSGDASVYLDGLYRGGNPYRNSGVTTAAASEDEWLSTCALRFDGYLYARQNDLPPDSGAVEHWFLREPNFEREPAFLMAAMFMLQRGLMKEGIRGKTSQGWRRFRQLFLQLCNQPVPTDHRLGGFYEQWDRQFAPRWWEGCRIVQPLHDAAHYGSHLY